MKFRKGFRIKKKKVLYCLLALVLCCCFVRNGMGLVKTNNRPNPGNSLSKQIKSKISDECKSSNPEDCLKYSLQLTSDLLSFTEKMISKMERLIVSVMPFYVLAYAIIPLK